MQLTLQKLANMHVGLTLRGKDSSLPGSGDGVHLLRISDIHEGGSIKIENHHPLREQATDVTKYLVKENDIVVANRGKRMTAALIPNSLDSQAVASGQLFIVRVDETQILSGYLHWFLNQKRIQQLLSTRTRGSYVKTLAISTLKDLPIDLPPIEIQHQIVAISKLAQEEERLQKDLITQRKIYTQAALSQLSKLGNTD